METLFNLPPAHEDRAPVSAHRAELDRALSDALRAVNHASRGLIDSDRAEEVFRRLASDGDTTWSRWEMQARIEVGNYGGGRLLDEMLDHINCIGIAFWRLHRAERRALKSAQ
jgi:hypothetical protein